jgi:hypothetical protein
MHLLLPMLEGDLTTMTYRKLRLELGNQTKTRTIHIEMGPEGNPGFNVVVEDIDSTGNVVSDRAVEFYSRKWHRTKVDAVSTAQGLVQTSIREGFVLTV